MYLWFRSLILLACLGTFIPSAMGQLVVGTNDSVDGPVSIQNSDGSFTPLFGEDAEGLAWDGSMFHGSNGSQYWTAPLIGPATIIDSFRPANDTSSIQVVSGLAFGNGTLFATDTSGTINSSNPEGIYSVAANGNSTILFNFAAAEINNLYQIQGLAFNPDDGLLYGTSDDSESRGLVRINIQNQTIELVAPYPNDEVDIDGLAIGDGIAYLIDDDDSSPGGGPGLFYSYDLSQGNNGAFVSFAAPWIGSESNSSGAFMASAPPEPDLAVLLIPDSFNDRVAAFSPVDGSVIDLNFIAADGILDQPFNAIDSGRGTIFISDDDCIFEYGLDGKFISTFAGPDQGLGNVRGLTVQGDSLFVNVTQGADSVDEFNLITGVQSTWTTTNLNSNQDITFRANDVLIGNFFTDNIERYDLDGNFLSTFHDSDGETSIDFPQQIIEASNGDVLIGGLVTPAGLYRFDADGNFISLSSIFDLGVRGVHELENGNFLIATSLGVLTFNPVTNQSAVVTTDMDGVWNFIEKVDVFSSGPTTETVPAASLNTLRGVLVSGDVTSVMESNDTYLKYNPGFTISPAEAPVWLIFDAALSTDTPAELELTIEATANTFGLTQTTEMFDFNSGQYVEIDVQPSTFNMDTVISIDVTGQIGDFVEPGTGAVRTRAGWRRTGFTLIFPWTVCIDNVAWNATSN